MKYSTVAVLALAAGTFAQNAQDSSIEYRDLSQDTPAPLTSQPGAQAQLSTPKPRIPHHRTHALESAHRTGTEKVKDGKRKSHHAKQPTTPSVNKTPVEPKQPAATLATRDFDAELELEARGQGGKRRSGKGRGGKRGGGKHGGKGRKGAAAAAPDASAAPAEAAPAEAAPEAAARNFDDEFELEARGKGGKRGGGKRGGGKRHGGKHGHKGRKGAAAAAPDASAAPAEAAPADAAPEGRSFDEDDLLALRDLVEELEARGSRGRGGRGGKRGGGRKNGGGGKRGGRRGRGGAAASASAEQPAEAAPEGRSFNEFDIRSFEDLFLNELD